MAGLDPALAIECSATVRSSRMLQVAGRHGPGDKPSDDDKLEVVKDDGDADSRRRGRPTPLFAATIPYVAATAENPAQDTGRCVPERWATAAPGGPKKDVHAGRLEKCFSRFLSNDPVRPC
jgi:hypothetical protein